jgi:hypothetical protein
MTCVPNNADGEKPVTSTARNPYPLTWKRRKELVLTAVLDGDGIERAGVFDGVSAGCRRGSRRGVGSDVGSEVGVGSGVGSTVGSGVGAGSGVGSEVGVAPASARRSPPGRVSAAPLPRRERREEGCRDDRGSRQECGQTETAR